MLSRTNRHQARSEQLLGDERVDDSAKLHVHTQKMKDFGRPKPPSNKQLSCTTIVH
jgi:hypothetical protein